jgi:hypothetical protein
MPIWLRRFTFNKIKEYYAAQEEAREKTNTSSIKKPQIARPNIKPNYTTKASK